MLFTICVTRAVTPNRCCDYRKISSGDRDMHPSPQQACNSVTNRPQSNKIPQASGPQPAPAIIGASIRRQCLENVGAGGRLRRHEAVFPTLATCFVGSHSSEFHSVLHDLRGPYAADYGGKKSPCLDDCRRLKRRCRWHAPLKAPWSWLARSFRLVFDYIV